MQPLESVKLKLIANARINFWIYTFISLHLIVWTLAPLLIRYTLPMDAMEGTVWGHQFEWGYDKNPFMNGWLTHFALQLGQNGWAIYLFSQFSVVLCFWSVWQLGKKIMPPLYALLGVLLLESIQYYNLHAIDLDDNVLELAFWSLTILFFYQALTRKTWWDWGLTGFFAGCSMMTKYYTAMLLIPMLVFMLYQRETRIQFKQPYLYFGLSVFCIFIMPHTLWLFSHDFVTINYALNRVSSLPHWSNHFFYPAQFAWQQIEVFLPAFVLIVLLVGKDYKKFSPSHLVATFDKTFLLIVGIGPFLLTLLLSALTGIKLRAGWGQPLLTYWGLFIFAYCLPNITRRGLKRFSVVLIAIFAGLATAYCISLYRANEPSSANFPGKAIALKLEQDWLKRYNIPLNFVVGSRWLSGNIAFYANSKPTVYIDADKILSPWINENKLKNEGAIFVWDPTEDHQMSFLEIKKRFPHLTHLQSMTFPWLRNKKMQPVEISLAFLPPEVRKKEDRS